MTASVVPPLAEREPAMPAGGGRRESGAPRRLFVVDLSCAERTRRHVRRLALFRLRGALAGRPAAVPPLVLVYAPQGGGPDPSWPADCEYLHVPDLVSEEVRADVYDWTFHASFDLVKGRGATLFPVVDGVSLGELGLLAMQWPMSNYGMLVAALREACARWTVERCTVISGYRSFAGALRADVRRLVPRVDGWTLPRFERARGALEAVAHRLTRRPRTGGGAPLEGVGAAGRARVLVVSESTPMAQTFSVVERHLAERGVGPVVRVQYGARAAAPERAPGLTILHGVRPSDQPAARRGRFLAHWDGVRERIRDFVPEAPAHGAPFALPFEAILEPLFELQFDQQAEHLERARAVLDAVRPEVVVVGNDRWWIGQAFVQLARQRGIPTLSVQDGVDGLHPTWYFITADHLAASGHHLARNVVRYGTSPARVSVTGQPRYDELQQPADPDARRRARMALGLDPEACQVLFAAQPMQDASYPQQVVAAALAVPGVRVILRPHPSSPVAEYEAIAEQYGPERVSLQRGSRIHDLLRAADVLVTQHSTVVIEAAILHTPVITANFTSLHEAAPYQALGIAAAARTPDELTARVRDVATARAPDEVAEQARRQAAALEALIGPSDAGAGRRVATLIERLLVGGA